MAEVVVTSSNTKASLVSLVVPEQLRAGLVQDAAASRDVVSLSLREKTGDSVVPAQYDGATARLWFVLREPSATDATWRLTPGARSVETDSLSTSCAQRLDRVELHVADEQFATYVVAGTRRPYFWPVLGPAGASVVRGQGSGDHPHHTGLALNYGGHAEGGSANIWSDWDEPPYGPGGRMLHRGFRRIVAGPVCGELVEDLTYLDALGEPIADEVRTIRWWWASATERFLDLEVEVRGLSDRGTSPFILMMRAPGCFGIPGVGAVTNATGAPVPEKDYTPESYFTADWVDMAGPTGEPPPPPPAGPPEVLPDVGASARRYRATGQGPWNGIAVFDHPDNHGYPGVVGKYATAQQITQTHYPPPGGGSFGFRQRIMVHDGDADQADVAGYASDYRSDPIHQWMP